MAVPTDAELRALLDRFVCVRLVQMWGVDLERFQFDMTMTWAVFFTHADGTVYGRYGTRSALREHSSRDVSLAGFKRSLAAAARLHERFAADPDAVRPELVGKQTRHAPHWPRAEAIPRLARNEKLAQPFAALAEDRSGRAHGVGCIHCHFVPDNELMSLREAKLPIDDRLIWPYPQPGSVGLRMDPEQRARVRDVAPGSPAAAAGVRPGDEIERFDGQTMLSPADVQWVLHHADGGDALALSLRRDGDAAGLVETTLRLPAGWREGQGNWRFTNLGVCMQIAGFNGRPADGGADGLAIRVQRVHPRRLAGIDLRQGDVITAIDGRREPMNLGQLTRYLLQKAPGSELEVTRRRRGQDGEVTARWRVD